MKRKVSILLVPAVVGGLFFGLAAPAGAEAPQPGGGPEFGQHIASMAPEHPKDFGAGFGRCVSTMATAGECPHTH